MSARSLYESRCVKCHRLYDPNDYSEEEWWLWMAKMSRKAKLHPRQERLLNRYVELLRADPLPSHSEAPIAGHKSLSQSDPPAAGEPPPGSNRHTR